MILSDEYTPSSMPIMLHKVISAARFNRTYDIDIVDLNNRAVSAALKKKRVLVCDKRRQSKVPEGHTQIFLAS